MRKNSKITCPQKNFHLQKPYLPVLENLEKEYKKLKAQKDVRIAEILSKQILGPRIAYFKTEKSSAFYDGQLFFFKILR